MSIPPQQLQLKKNASSKIGEFIRIVEQTEDQGSLETTQKNDEKAEFEDTQSRSGQQTLSSIPEIVHDLIHKDQFRL